MEEFLTQVCRRLKMFVNKVRQVVAACKKYIFWEVGRDKIDVAFFLCVNQAAHACVSLFF